VAAAVPAPSALAPGVGPARPKPVAKPGDAHVTIVSDPRCELLVDGVPYGATPLIDLAVPAGKHTIILLNSSQGIKEMQKVTLSTGQLWTRSFQYEGGKMVMSNGLSAKMLAGREEKAAPKEEHVVAAAEPKKESAPSTRPKAVEGAASAPVEHEKVAAPAPKHQEAPPPPPSTKPSPPPAAPPPAAAPMARTVAGFVLDAQKLSGDAARLPEFVILRESGKKLVGTYKICVNKDGHVYDVTTIASITGADGDIMSTLRSWKYKPQTGNVCAAKVLSFAPH
jgi:hypothetical protein